MKNLDIEKRRSTFGLTIICVALMVCLAGFGGWTYARMDSVQKQITDLEARNDQLEAQVAGLETEVENLTNIIEAMASLTFTFLGTEKLEIKTVTWTSPDKVTLKVDNTGTKAVTVTGVKVNYGNVPCTSTSTPVTIDTDDYKNIDITFTNNYTVGTVYDLTVVTSEGHEYTRTATGGQNIT